jgi:hypothetical protein
MMRWPRSTVGRAGRSEGAGVVAGEQRGPGRPHIGRRMTVRVPGDLRDWLDELADAGAGSRSDLVRDMLAYVRRVGWPPPTP